MTLRDNMIIYQITHTGDMDIKSQLLRDIKDLLLLEVI